MPTCRHSLLVFFSLRAVILIVWPPLGGRRFLPICSEAIFPACSSFFFGRGSACSRSRCRLWGGCRSDNGLSLRSASISSLGILSPLIDGNDTAVLYAFHRWRYFSAWLWAMYNRSFAWMLEVLASMRSRVIWSVKGTSFLSQAHDPA